MKRRRPGIARPGRGSRQHAEEIDMAKAPAAFPRGRGRPNADNTALFDDILVEWVRTGGPYGRGLDQAVRAVVTQDSAGRVKVKSLREGLRTWVKRVDGEKMMLRAIAVAQERGVPLPEWLNAELAETQRRNRASEVALDAEPERLVQGRSDAIDNTNQFLERRARRLAEAEPEGDRLRQLVAFIRAFDQRLPLDTPISTIHQLFTECDALIAARLRRQK
jgi:hypothetical protein